MPVKVLMKVHLSTSISVLAPETPLLKINPQLGEIRSCNSFSILQIFCNNSNISQLLVNVTEIFEANAGNC